MATGLKNVHWECRFSYGNYYGFRYYYNGTHRYFLPETQTLWQIERQKQFLLDHEETLVGPTTDPDLFDYCVGLCDKMIKFRKKGDKPVDEHNFFLQE